MAAVMEERAIGDVVLKADEVTVTFGAVKALTGVSFEVREREILAIIGPNGAGKTTMLNVINGFYHPDSGLITFKGQTRRRMRPHVAAAQGIARTFQNVALFKGMSTLDNIMTGRNLRMSRWATNIVSAAIYYGPTQKEEIAHRERAERHRFSGDPVNPKDAGGSIALWASKTCGIRSGTCSRAGLVVVRRTYGWYES